MHLFLRHVSQISWKLIFRLKKGSALETSVPSDLIMETWVKANQTLLMPVMLMSHWQGKLHSSHTWIMGAEHWYGGMKIWNQ